MSAIDKFSRFVDLLWEKTQQDKIPWDYDITKNVCKVWGGSNLTQLSVDTDENLDSIYTITLFNSSGIVLDSFSDPYREEANPGPEFKNYYSKMEQLFQLAKKRATGADKALDNFISLLENDGLDVPF